MSETPDKISPPQTGGVTLLPASVGLVGGGVLAAIAAQLFVSGDNFTYLYSIIGVELPYLLRHLVDNPVLLPTAYLLAAVAMLLSPRLELPLTRGAAYGVRGLALTGVGFVMLHAAGVAWLLPNTLRTIQTTLQQ